jgi:hypothetical protein
MTKNTSSGVNRTYIIIENVFGVGPAPSNQTVESLLITPGQQRQPGKQSERSFIGFDKLKNLTK